MVDWTRKVALAGGASDMRAPQRPERHGAAQSVAARMPQPFLCATVSILAALAARANGGIRIVLRSWRLCAGRAVCSGSGSWRVGLWADAAASATAIPLSRFLPFSNEKDELRSAADGAA